MTRWSSDPSALELLERHGGPFSSAAFRSAWTESYAEDTDISWGGRLTDGTRAAVPLMKFNDVAESFPLNYGGVVATRQLMIHELRSFLDTARRTAACRWILVRSAPIGPAEHLGHFGSPIGGWTDVVRITKGADMEATFGYKARRSIRAALSAGARPVTSRDPDAFLSLYEPASRRHIYRYPETIVRALARRRLAWFHQVELEGRCVAGVMVLRSPTHWIAWLAAQNDEGRTISANYLALAEVIRAGSADGTPAINLGISYGMPGVSHFKRNFGALAVPVTHDRIGSPLASALEFGKETSRTLSQRFRKASRRVRRRLGGE